jgi:undecaprenyl-diphosphatase
MPVVRAVVHLDFVIQAWVVAHRARMLDPVMIALSIFGNGGLGWLLVASVLTLARRLHGRTLLQLILALICTTLIADHVMKPLAGRARPFERTPEMVVIGVRPGGASFPSGHATAAGAAALLMSSGLPAGRVLWWLLAFAIAYSRVYLGDHYPLDVAAGAALGAAIAWLIARATAPRRG